MAYYVRSGTTLYDSDLTFKEEIQYQYGRAKKRVVDPYINRARSEINKARSYMSQGPLISRAMDRADEIALKTGNYKPLARLAGKRPLYDRLFSGYGHQVGKQWAKEALGLPSLHGVNASGFAKDYWNTGSIGKNLFGRALGVGFTAYMAYEGYQKEGMWGAAKGVGESVGYAYLSGRIMGGIVGGGALTALAAGTAAAGMAYGGLKLAGAFTSDASSFGLKNLVRDQTYEYRRRNASMDLGTPSIDPFGNNATIRQRSLSAIQNSRLNGRSMLGNEASTWYKPW